MRITIVLGAFLPVPPVMGGAVEKIWFALAQEFARRGHTVTQISRAVAEFPASETLEDVNHIRVKGFDAPKSLLWLKFLDLIYSWRIRSVLPASDVIVTNTFWLPVLLRSESCGKLYVHVARFPKGQMRLYRHAARLQTPSQDVARAITEEQPALADRILVIPNPLSRPMDPEAPPPLSRRERIILYVGRLHPEKGIGLLIKAFVALHAGRTPDWRLVIVGPAEAKHGGGGPAYFEELKAAASGAGGRVEFRGAIFDPEALDREYRAARLFVYPSLAERGESFGVAPLEAMANGCPVLVSGLACFCDFIDDGATGFVFDHRQPDPAKSLSDKMAQVLDDEVSLARVGEAGWRKAAEYALPRVADQFLADFAELQKQWN
jgi:glycosyltransferase involved in cell wall biosynthesis